MAAVLQVAGFHLAWRQRQKGHADKGNSRGGACIVGFIFDPGVAYADGLSEEERVAPKQTAKN